MTKAAGHCPGRREDVVEAGPEHQLASPPATWQEHYHNVSDSGLDTWREGNALARELPAHEIGH